MKKVFFSLLILCSFPVPAWAQVSGNIGYGDGRGSSRAEQFERAKRVPLPAEFPPTATTSFVESNVMMNVRADEYVAVFGVSQSGTTLAEASEKMDNTLKTFRSELKTLGVAAEDVSVDFIAQTKTYGFELKGDILEEKLVGFDLKKNVSIRYKASDQIEKLTLSAAKSQIYDLIKVDYVVLDIARVQDQLMDEATSITKKKIARYEKLLGIKLQPPAQIYAEKFSTHYPTRMYDSYTASESEAISGGPERQKYTIRSARKSRTFFYNGLSADGFDVVINPVITEPVVQFTLYLKVKYEVEQVKPK